MFHGIDFGSQREGPTVVPEWRVLIDLTLRRKIAGAVDGLDEVVADEEGAGGEVGTDV
jgi:hypothetical protein